MKKRLLACLLTAAMLVSLFPLPALAAEAERPEWMVTAFDPLDRDIAAQTVPQGGEPVLPDSLTAWAYVIEDDTEAIPLPEETEQEGEQPQPEEPVETEDIQPPVDGQEGPEDEQLPSDNAGEPSTPDVTLVSRTAENTPEPAEKQEPDIQPVTIPDVTWEAQPEFDPDAPGEYVYTPVLPAAYEVAGEVELPVISVTVTAAEQTALQRVQTMIDALPAPEDIIADNRDEVEAQLAAIGVVWAELSNEEALQIDTARLEAARDALAVLDGQTGNELPAPLAGETGDFTVTGGMLNTDYSYENSTLTIKTSMGLKISGSGSPTTDKIVIADGVAANVTLQNVSIDVSGTDYACAFEVAGSASCTLTLTGINTLKSGWDRAGLQVRNGAALVITQGSAGSLNATGGVYGAGIGSTEGVTAGNITINGGDITATGGLNATGIGAGCNATGGEIIINGGTVKATRGGDAYDIGGGAYHSAEKIVIGDGANVTNGSGDPPKLSPFHGVNKYKWAFSETQHWRPCGFSGCKELDHQGEKVDHTWTPKTDTSTGASIKECVECGYISYHVVNSNAWELDGAYYDNAVVAGDKERKFEPITIPKVVDGPILPPGFLPVEPVDTVRYYAAIVWENDDRFKRGCSMALSTFFYCLNPVYQAAKGGEGEKSLAAFSFLCLLAGETTIKGSNYAD